ncbi:hypothetical protein FQN57_004992 [Myotisia sp. PD_48]|nr:hypothetical protein FQN57_004992 [Myotisia sp. PD_48]
MNDPEYDANNQPGLQDEPDTCRICRGEGTEEEQLFYPCKCSGSIKFVHQSCLMEWLSHSQKKYCELCKTPFRFTKIYDPDMPEQLPVPVFLKELLLYGCRSLLTWLRFVLVAFVWLGWLPWSMRAIWRGLFWLADGRWPSPEVLQRPASSPINQTLLAFLSPQSTSPATHTLASHQPAVSTATATIAGNSSQLRSISSMFNFTTGEPLVYSVAKALFTNVFVPSSSSSNLSTTPPNSTLSAVKRIRQPSWLSDVAFLTNLTPYPTINNIIIDTLEGQLITLLVVISFILIFLIREWVVQQQPAINLADGEGEAAGQLILQGVEHAELPEEGVPELVVGREGEAASEGGTIFFTDAEPNPVINDMENVPPSSPADGENGVLFRGSNEFANPFLARGGLEHLEYPNDDQEPGPSRIHNFNGYQFNPSIQLPFDSPSLLDDAHPESVFDTTNSSHQSRFNQYQQGESGSSERSDQYTGWSFPADLPDIRASFDESDIEIFPHPIRIPNSGDSTEDESSFQFPNRGSISFQSSHDAEERYEHPGSSSPVALHAEPENIETPERNFTEPSGPNPGGERLDTRVAAPTDQNDSVPTLEDAPKGYIDSIFNWFWGDIPEPPPEARNENNEGAQEPRQQPGAAAQPGQVDGPADLQPAQPLRWGRAPPEEVRNQANEQEPVEDADDLEGVMELIGMQGPIFGLLQNAVFSALLISFTVSIGIWLPYLWGKIALVMLVNPVATFINAPFLALEVAADVTLDMVVGSFAYMIYAGNVLMRALVAQLGKFLPGVAKFSEANAITMASLSLMEGSGQRLKTIVTALFNFHESDLPMFSILSHEALKLNEARVIAVAQLVFDIGKAIVCDIPLTILNADNRISLLKNIVFNPTNLYGIILHGLQRWSQALDPVFSFGSPNVLDKHATFTVDHDIAHWSTNDRIVAILVGYCFVTIVGVLYIRLSAYFSGTEHDGAIAEILRQAGGVMKVIVIIGIEMIVFPLYCGVLLDIALLPLFDNAVFMSRTAFTMDNPVTSLFVHWFIGTCYMFHFALFVSMCRKIMRDGVLCKFIPIENSKKKILDSMDSANLVQTDFIRDPDDPTFHPVRDVLERNITTQLRKIAFSALVYGGLVIICLGGVVWGLSITFKGILPVYWSSNEPVLEFPVDLLFYNFIMPLAIRAIRPSDGLQNIYEWWFRECARVLRLTHFLFGVRQPDEEGRFVYNSWGASILARLTRKTEQVDAESDVATGSDTPPSLSTNSGHFVPDGKFVRAPASDQVRIPKGTLVFVEVDSNNERIDGKPDVSEGLHGKDNEMFATIYIPPNFRARITTFLLLLWVFAAATGVGTTIIPLVIGRRMVSFLFPPHIRVNDIYALSAGVYFIGALYYGFMHVRNIFVGPEEGLGRYRRSPKQVLQKVYRAISISFQLAYMVAAVGIFLPSIFALATEFFVLIPLHTYLNGGETHVIHFVQDWTLGILYVRMVIRFLLRKPKSLPAKALKSIVRNGWTKPDVRLATRVFFVPVTLFLLTAILCPLPIGFLLNSTVLSSSLPTIQSQTYRYCYPGFLAFVLLLWGIQLFYRQISVWRVSIRDDVYMIGERLHNFSERRAKNVGAARRMLTG